MVNVGEGWWIVHFEVFRSERGGNVSGDGRKGRGGFVC